MSDSWSKMISYRPFAGFFQDDMSFGNALYTTINIRTIFLYLAILGTTLSLTGIFALSTLNVNGHMKEIGIPKVLGARSKSILFTLNRQF